MAKKKHLYGLEDRGSTLMGAQFSTDGKFRYSLWRVWDESKKYVIFIGLNPSSADHKVDDPTIRRCRNYAKCWGFGGIYMINLFSLRATDPKVLKRAPDPIGPYGDEVVARLSQRPQMGLIVCAWSNHGHLFDRGPTVRRYLEGPVCDFRDLFALRITKVGCPSHPLYLPKKLVPRYWCSDGVLGKVAPLPTDSIKD